MEYLKVKKEKLLYNENFTKFYLLKENKLLTVKQAYNLKQKYYNFSNKDVFVYIKEGEKNKNEIL